MTILQIHSGAPHETYTELQFSPTAFSAEQSAIPWQFEDQMCVQGTTTTSLGGLAPFSLQSPVVPLEPAAALWTRAAPSGRETLIAATGDKTCPGACPDAVQWLTDWTLNQAHKLCTALEFARPSARLSCDAANFWRYAAALQSAGHGGKLAVLLAGRQRLGVKAEHPQQISQCGLNDAAQALLALEPGPPRRGRRKRGLQDRVAMGTPGAGSSPVHAATRHRPPSYEAPAEPHQGHARELASWAYGAPSCCPEALEDSRESAVLSALNRHIALGDYDAALHIYNESWGTVPGNQRQVTSDWAALLRTLLRYNALGAANDLYYAKLATAVAATERQLGKELAIKHLATVDATAGTAGMVFSERAKHYGAALQAYATVVNSCKDLQDQILERHLLQQFCNIIVAPLTGEMFSAAQWFQTTLLQSDHRARLRHLYEKFRTRVSMLTPRHWRRPPPPR